MFNILNKLKNRKRIGMLEPEQEHQVETRI